MKEDYENFSKRMEERFPLIFHGKYGGFAVGEGWYLILETLCANIQSHIDWQTRQCDKFGRGQTVPQVVVEQIKEKFGGLRFYYQGGDDTIHGMVRMAEEWASHSCEECGIPGRRRNGGWIRTLCDLHETEHELKRNSYAKSNSFEL